MKIKKRALGILFNLVILAVGGFGYIRYRDTKRPPEINVWFPTAQVVGQSGLAQNQVNIIGNVFDLDGIKSLYYSLNSSTETHLSYGPDSRRLEKTGDFNIDLPIEDLNQGINTVTIFAWDQMENKREKEIKLFYDPKDVQLPFRIIWNQIDSIDQVGMVVDGKWEITDDGLGTEVPGYDRLVAIGDFNWKNYDVFMKYRINSVVRSGWEYPSGSPGVGLILRWQGHTDFPKAGWQPRSGWLPLGAITWIRWDEDKQGAQYQILEGNEGTVIVSEDYGRNPQTGDWFMIRAQADTNSNNETIYRVKFWADDEEEPGEWMLEAEYPSLDSGSIGILAHQVDITVGEISVYPLEE